MRRSLFFAAVLGWIGLFPRVGAPLPTSTPTPTATPSATPTPTVGCGPSLTLAEVPPEYVGNFGVAAAADGGRVVVGAQQSGTNDDGKAYLLDLDDGSILKTFTNPSAGFADFFGSAVAISGNLVLVGARGDNTSAEDAGSAFVFDATTGGLLQTLDNPTAAASDFFGGAVAIDGNNALVGAYSDNSTTFADCGAAHLFNASTGAFLRTLESPSAQLYGSFGNAVAISGDHALVGAVGEEKAYLFNVTTGALERTLTRPAPGDGGQFGSAVAIVGDDVYVGAPSIYFSSEGRHDGRVFRFDRASGAVVTLYFNPTFANDRFGASISVSGGSLLIGAPEADPSGAQQAGAAYWFEVATGTLLRILNNPAPGSDERFGSSVALSGPRAFVGAPSRDVPAGAGNDSGGGNLYDLTSPCASPTPTISLTPTASLTPSLTPTISPTATPTPSPSMSLTPSPTASPTPSVSPSPSPSPSPTPSAQDVLNYLLGVTTNPAGLDLNQDGKVDAADLLIVLRP